jgi:aminopeptidase N
MRAGGVALEAFAPRGHARLSRAQLGLVADGLTTLGDALGPYPYTRLVVVIPPRAARGSEGMEYPGLFVTQHASALTGPFTFGIAHDVVTSHELAHQWFPMVLGSDEVTYPWLDEGVAQWLGTHLVRARYGARSVWSRLLGLPLDPFALQAAAYRLASAPPSSLLPAPRYRPAQLAPSVYLRPALALESVARAWGRPRLIHTLGDFARRQRFAHPRPEALFATFDRHYFPGFSKRVLRPMLEGEDPPSDLPPRADLLGRTRAREPAQATSHAPLARVLTLAHAALGLLGP